MIPDGERDRTLADAKAGKREAQYFAGLMHFYGEGLEQDDAEAAHYFRQAAQQGHPQAMMNLGVMLLTGRGVAAADERAALAYFRAAAADPGGGGEAQWLLAQALYEGRGLEAPRHAEAVQWFERCAAEGAPDRGASAVRVAPAVQPAGAGAGSRGSHGAPSSALAKCQFGLGVMKEYGLGTPRGFREAAGLYRRASDRGHLDATYYLALMHAYGRRADAPSASAPGSGGAPEGGRADKTPADKTPADKTPARAASTAVDGVAQDLAAARLLFQVAAERGHQGAQYYMGLMCTHGYGGSGVDLDLAVYWLERAARAALAETDPAAGDGAEGSAGAQGSAARPASSEAQAAVAALARKARRGGVDYGEVLGSGADVEGDPSPADLDRRRGSDAGTTAKAARALDTIRRMTEATRQRLAEARTAYEAPDAGAGEVGPSEGRDAQPPGAAGPRSTRGRARPRRTPRRVPLAQPASRRPPPQPPAPSPRFVPLTDAQRRGLLEAEERRAKRAIARRRAQAALSERLSADRIKAQHRAAAPRAAAPAAASVAAGAPGPSTDAPRTDAQKTPGASGTAPGEEDTCEKTPD
jgi:TPR repeat protein